MRYLILFLLFGLLCCKPERSIPEIDKSGNYTITQLGKKIKTPNSFIALSDNGSIVAIADEFGDTKVFSYDSTSVTWKQLGNDIINTEGTSVSISNDGTLLAVGFPNEGNSGVVRVYLYGSDTTWTQFGNDIIGKVDGEQSGYSVSLSGDGRFLAIGAPEITGVARVYSLGSNSEWYQIGDDLVSYSYERFGHSVSLSDNGAILASSAPFSPPFPPQGLFGRVKVYENILGVWSQQGEDIIGEVAGDYSGYSIALCGDGTFLAIAAEYNDNSNNDAGHVRVYHYDTSTHWTKLGSDIDGLRENDRLGSSVSFSNNGAILAVGARNYSPDGLGMEGQTKLFHFNSGDWTQLGADINGKFYEYSGTSVSISGDGTILAVGAPGDNISSQNSVSVYQISK
ncbi:MAG: FG-GAP repeat protein [Bacteroidia bacterium]|nr:FG-GAP repeat protein [Bacteroidia bacterium]NNJ55179.1 hypothetical protein [Bacteroidia bacterium]